MVIIVSNPLLIWLETNLIITSASLIETRSLTRLPILRSLAPPLSLRPGPNGLCTRRPKLFGDFGLPIAVDAEAVETDGGLEKGGRRSRRGSWAERGVSAASAR